MGKSKKSWVRVRRDYGVKKEKKRPANKNKIPNPPQHSPHALFTPTDTLVNVIFSMNSHRHLVKYLRQNKPPLRIQIFFRLRKTVIVKG